MNTIETMTSFLGWCAVINVGLLLLSTLLVIMLRDRVSSIHANLFCMDKKDVLCTYFQYLGQYKIAIIVLNIVPYFALKVMG
jgi:hypothetical protein